MWGRGETEEKTFSQNPISHYRLWFQKRIISQKGLFGLNKRHLCQQVR